MQTLNNLFNNSAANIDALELHQEAATQTGFNLLTKSDIRDGFSVGRGGRSNDTKAGITSRVHTKEVKKNTSNTALIAFEIQTNAFLVRKANALSTDLLKDLALQDGLHFENVNASSFVIAGDTARELLQFKNVVIKQSRARVSPQKVALWQRDSDVNKGFWPYTQTHHALAHNAPLATKSVSILSNSYTVDLDSDVIEGVEHATIERSTLASELVSVLAFEACKQTIRNDDKAVSDAKSWEHYQALAALCTERAGEIRSQASEIAFTFGSDAKSVLDALEILATKHSNRAKRFSAASSAAKKRFISFAESVGERVSLLDAPKAKAANKARQEAFQERKKADNDTAWLENEKARQLIKNNRTRANKVLAELFVSIGALESLQNEIEVKGIESSLLTASIASFYSCADSLRDLIKGDSVKAMQDKAKSAKALIKDTPSIYRESAKVLETTSSTARDINDILAAHSVKSI